jgi:hypothetical protein
MRRMRVALFGVCLALVAGCGGEEQSAADLPTALGYVPRDAFVVAVVPTDLEGDQLRRLDHLIAPALRESEEKSLRDIAAGLSEDADVDFDREVAPLLGGELVLAAWGDFDEPDALVALGTPDGDKARALLRRLHAGPDVARVDGDTIIFALSGDKTTLDAAVERRTDGQGLDAAGFEKAFGDGAGDDALARVIGDPQVLARALDVDVDLPWIQALDSAALSLRLDEDEIEGRARLRTRPDGLREEDLPLASGEDAPEAGEVDGVIAAANRDQSRTTVFLAQVARKAYPDSEFVHEVEALETDLGISFEDAVLAQFNGPSASIATPDGAFAAVSDVADPEAMRALLPRLAPRLPPILRGLQGLGNRGLIALLLFAPDAPLVPGALPALIGDIAVRPLGGAGKDEQLYEITGLDDESEERAFAVPTVVFGMIGDRFVVATDAQRARAAAQMEVSEVDDAHGAGVARADFGTWSRKALIDAIGFEIVPLGEATGELEASVEGVEGRLRVSVPGGLD